MFPKQKGIIAGEKDKTILRGCPTPDSTTGLQPRRECSRSRQPRRTRRPWRPKLDCVSRISGQAIGPSNPQRKRARVEKYTVKRSRRSHNRRLQLAVDSASRADSSWPRREDRQSGDFLQNRCHRLPQKGCPGAEYCPSPCLRASTSRATFWALWVSESTASSPHKRPESNPIRAMLCPDCSIRR